MSEEFVTIKFTRALAPYQWSAESLELPGVVGLGDSMASALKSWTDSLPNTLLNQRRQLETLTLQQQQERRK
jgi:hypothetical protein